MGSSLGQRKKTQKLGTLIKIYQDRPLVWRDLIFTFTPASLAVLAPLIYGIQRAQYARAYYGPVAAQAWSKPWYLLSAVALIPLLLLGILRIRSSHRGVFVYKNGLSIKGMGRSNRKIGWREISGIVSEVIQIRFLGITLRKRNQVTLLPSNGKPIKLDSRIPKLDELSTRIKAKIYPRLIPELRSSLNSGSTLQFGPIQINRNSIQIRDRTYSWDQITGIQVIKGSLVVGVENRTGFRIPVRDIPNIELFIQLIQEGLIA